MTDTQELRLTDLISVETLQAIQDGFAAVTGMAALTTDENGNPVTQGSNFTEFCMQLTRKCPEGARRCEKCDRDGGQRTMSTHKATAYSCHAGLVDFAAPIMVNGKMIGSFIGGQVLTAEPDESKFRHTAVELGINEERYLDAVRKVKILDKQQIDNAADFLCTIANMLSQSAYDNYVTRENNEALSMKNTAVFEKITNALSGIETTKNCISELSAAFDNLSGIAGASSEEVSKTTETVKELQNVALNMKILGFNASIEASAAKEAGKGFGVIAQEVRSLAETSQGSADDIQNSINTIQDHSDDINAQIKQTKKVIKKVLDELSDFTEILGAIKIMHEDT